MRLGTRAKCFESYKATNLGFKKTQHCFLSGRNSLDFCWPVCLVCVNAWCVEGGVSACDLCRSSGFLVETLRAFILLDLNSLSTAFGSCTESQRADTKRTWSSLSSLLEGWAHVAPVGDGPANKQLSRRCAPGSSRAPHDQSSKALYGFNSPRASIVFTFISPGQHCLIGA